MRKFVKNQPYVDRSLEITRLGHILSRFDTAHKCDRQTDRQTEMPQHILTCMQCVAH